ncbi:MAG: cytochrome c [Magnetococcales bacterium]|nr:cytochrome c [Magnetococcales bacterium]
MAGGVGSARADAPSPQRAVELDHLLRHDCGSCHGMTLQGGLGPPLTVAALRDRSPEALADAIRLGRPAGAMPPWGPLLNEGEIQWLVDRLRRGESP